MTEPLHINCTIAELRQIQEAELRERMYGAMFVPTLRGILGERLAWAGVSPIVLHAQGYVDENGTTRWRQVDYTLFPDKAAPSPPTSGLPPLVPRHQKRRRTLRTLRPLH